MIPDRGLKVSNPIIENKVKGLSSLVEVNVVCCRLYLVNQLYGYKLFKKKPPSPLNKGGGGPLKFID